MKNAWLILGFLFSFTLVSCDKDDPDIPNEEELITKVIFELSPQGGGLPIHLVFSDLDGDGGNDPVILADTLSANTTYDAKMYFLNETETPVDTVNAEILDEALEHQVFYVVESADLTVQYEDADLDGNPIGLETTVNSGNSGTGSLRVVLRHQPDKSAAGASTGNPSNAGGESDVDLTYPIVIQ